MEVGIPTQKKKRSMSAVKRNRGGSIQYCAVTLLSRLCHLVSWACRDKCRGSKNQETEVAVVCIVVVRVARVYV